MARKHAEMADGMKGPQARGEQAVPAQPNFTLPSPVSSPSKPGMRRFASRSLNYRLQVTSPSDTFDMLTGKKAVHRGKVAIFAEGFLETDDPEVIERIENSRFYGSDFWDADEKQAESLRVSAEALVAAVQSHGDPALRARLIEALGGKVVEEFNPEAA